MRGRGRGRGRVGGESLSEGLTLRGAKKPVAAMDTWLELELELGLGLG